MNRLSGFALAGMVLLFPALLAAEETFGASFETFESASLMSEKELSSQRGTFLPETLNLSSTLGASSSNNVSIGSITGSNNINSSAFNNTSGLVNLIQNSGNNVIIQSSTVLNVQLAQ